MHIHHTFFHNEKKFRKFEIQYCTFSINLTLVLTKLSFTFISSLMYLINKQVLIDIFKIKIDSTIQ